jgi:hypothetical protein
MFKHRRSLVADEPPFAPSGASRKDKVIRAPRIVLATDQSETVRDRLVAEISDLKSADEAADWVHKNLPAKNTLADVDAEIVEASFRKRLATLEVGHVSANAPNASAAAANASAIPSDEPNPVQAKRSTFTREPPLSRPLSGVVALQRKPFAYATRSTANLSPRTPASCAAARPPKRTTFALHNRVRSTARSVTSTRSQSAASIIASCTDMAMKPRGGPG